MNFRYLVFLIFSLLSQGLQAESLANHDNLSISGFWGGEIHDLPNSKGPVTATVSVHTKRKSGTFYYSERIKGKKISCEYNGLQFDKKSVEFSLVFGKANRSKKCRAFEKIVFSEFSRSKVSANLYSENNVAKVILEARSPTSKILSNNKEIPALKPVQKKKEAKLIADRKEQPRTKKTIDKLPVELVIGKSFKGTHAGMSFSLQLTKSKLFDEKYLLYHASKKKNYFLKVEENCNKVMGLNLGQRGPGWGAFHESGQAKDVPEITKSAVRASFEVLSAQCPKMQALRVHTTLKRPYPHGAPSYVGSVLKKGGIIEWVDGVQGSADSKDYKFKLSVSTHFSPMSVVYNGPCEQEPILLIQPVFGSEWEKSSKDHKTYDISDYWTTAFYASAKYRSFCPDTKIIRYIAKPLPYGQMCKKTGDCFLIHRYDPDQVYCKQRGTCHLRNLIQGSPGAKWEKSSEQFKFLPPPPISSLRDMEEVLAAGRFDILNDYSNWHAYYFVTFIEAYSDSCNSYMSDHTTILSQRITTNYDGYWNFINEERGQLISVHVENKYFNFYKRLEKTSSLWMAKRFFLKLVGYGQPDKPLGENYKRAFKIFSNNLQYIQALFRKNRCDSDYIQTIYENMYRFVANEKPIEGKYPTDKEPYVVPTIGDSSAPKSLENILREDEYRYGWQGL